MAQTVERQGHGLPGVSAPSANGSRPRPVVRGKFLWAGGQKLFVKGATYGTFRPDQNGAMFPSPEVVAPRLRGDGGQRSQLGAHLHRAA